MLSRTAENLFWLGRYIERADNIARLLEAGRRFDTLAGKTSTQSNEWAAVLITAGCRDTFPGDVEQATAREAIHHIVLGEENPSSLQNCFALARGNARAQRGAITADTWSAANEAWRESQKLTELDCSPRYLASTLERMRQYTALFRGSVAATMLRDARLNFLRAGQSIERADATARLMDVKYHVLMHDDHPVGSAMDKLQWNNILRAAGARSSYRWVYRKPVEARLVIDFLLLNPANPRSFRNAAESVAGYLANLHQYGSANEDGLTEVTALLGELRQHSATDVINIGLHEYLTSLVNRTNSIALSIGSDFGFRPIITGDTEFQTQ